MFREQDQASDEMRLSRQETVPGGVPTAAETAPRPAVDAKEEEVAGHRGGPQLRNAAPPADFDTPIGKRHIAEVPQLPGKEPLARSRGRRTLRRGGLLRRRLRTFLIGLALAVAATAAAYLYWDFASHFERTDDAFIAARAFAIAPKVSGYITAVPVTDNEHVAAGSVIAQIDDRDYRIALDQAQAQVASAEAGIANIDAQLNLQQAQINADQAQVDQVEAALVYAQQQAGRFQDLAKRGAASTQEAQNWASQLRQQEAGLARAKATLTLAQRQVEVLEAQRNSAVASLGQAKAQRDQAKLNLSYTAVRADGAGRVVNLTAATGEFVQPGTNLTMFVPDELWVTANFKETQLGDMRSGQPVTIHIDAYPERILRGHIASIQPGSGTAFALLPAENATGNYVKIVQRVPVKIVMDDPPSDVALGPGMSVVPSVRVNPNPSLYEELRGWL